MPDYRVIPSNPIVDAIDRRASSYMAAGPVVTDFSAGVQGLEQGLDFGTKLTDRILTTQRENDPDRLAAEQLRRDLLNQQVREAIRTSNIENTLDETFGFEDRSLDQLKTSAGIGQSLATTRKTNIQAQLEEQFGAQEKESLINQRRNQAFKTDLQSDLLERYGKQKEQSIIDKNNAQANKAKGIVAPRGPNPFQPRQIPNPTSASGETNVSPEVSKIADQLQLSEEEVKAELANTQSSNYQQRTQAQDQATESDLTTRKAKDEYNRTSRARTNLEEALIHIEDVDYQGKPSYPGVLGKVAVANQLYEEEIDPKRKALRAAEISTMIRGMGVDGAQDHIDALEGEDKKYHETILSAAIANSGDTSLYTDDMKTIVGAGLDSQHAADPEKTYSQVEQLINDGPVNVEDTKIKEELPFSEYVMAASRASLGGTRAYKIMPGRVNVSSGATDIAGEGQQSQPGARFTDMQGKDLLDNEGNKIFAPKPTNQKEKSELSLVMKIASRQQQSIPQQQQVQQGVTELQQQPSQIAAPAGQPSPQPIQQSSNRNPPFFKGLTDESQLPQLFDENIVSIAHDRYDQNEKNPARLGVDQTKAYYPTVKDIVDDVSKDTTLIRGNQEQIQEVDALVNYALATKNANYIGPNAKLDQLEENIKTYLPGGLADENKKRLMDMFSRAQMLAKLSKLSGQVRAFDTPAEMENLIKGTINPNSTIGTIITLKMLLEAENKQKNALNDIRNVGISKQILEPAIRRAENAYLASDVSKALIKNPKMGQPGETDFIPNPNFQDGMTFLGLRDKPTPSGTTNTQTNNPDVVNSPQTAQEADVVKKNSNIGPGDSGSAQPISIKENLPPEADPKYQEIIQKFKEAAFSSAGGKTGFTLEKGKKIFPEGIQSGLKDEDIIAGVDYLADTILFNSGEEIMTGFGLAGEKQKQFERARQLARDEFQKNNVWTAGAMDAFGTVVDMVLTGGAAKKIIGEALTLAKVSPQTIQKFDAAASRLGKTSGGTPHAELLGQAGLDGLMNALRQEDDSNLEEFFTGAAVSGVLQKGFVPIANGVKGVSGKILRLFGSSDPADIALAKKLMKEGGATKEDLLDSLQEAKDLSSQQEGVEINPLGTQSPEARGVLKGVTDQPAARPGVNLTAADRDKAASVAIEGSERAAGLSNVRPEEAISSDFKTVVDEVVNEEIAVQTATKEATKGTLRQTAEQEKESALAEIIKTTSDAGKTGQQVIDDIAALTGVKVKSITEGGAKAQGGTDTETLLPTTIKQLKRAKEIVGKLLRGGPNNQGAIFRQLERKYKNLDEDIIKKLDDKLRDKFPQQAPGWINAIARATEQLKTVEGTGADEGVKTAVVNNSFRFLDELRQYVDTKESGASRQVAEEIKALILKAGDDAIEAAGGGKGVYTQFAKEQLPKLYKVEEGLQTLIDTQETVANQLEKTGSGKLHDPLFNTPAAREKVTTAYGNKASGKVELQTRVYDNAVSIIDGLDKDTSQIKIADLADNFKEANTLANNQEFFAEKLIKQGSGAINRLRRTLGPRERNLLEEGTRRALKTRMDNFKGNVEGANFRPFEMFGLDDAEWKTVKQLVGPEKSKLLETMLERKMAIEKGLKIFQTDAAARTGAPASAAEKMTIRRMVETAMQFTLDLLSDMGLKTAAQKETEAIVRGLGLPPKELDLFIRSVADRLETLSSKAGTTTQLKGFSEDSMQKARILLYAVWSAHQDSGDARSNTAHKEALKMLENMKKNETLH